MSTTFTKPGYKAVGESKTSPPENTARKQVTVDIKDRTTSGTKEPVTIFYVGGAGDKRAYPPIELSSKQFGPNGNIVDVQRFVEKNLKAANLNNFYRPYYLGYYEIYGSEQIKANVLQSIPTKNSPVFIIGHSLGGWNGAHLSGRLNEIGYRIEMLVTLDPVGEGQEVALASDIYVRTPKPAGKFWINVRAEAKTSDDSDKIADLGGQWNVRAGPHVSATVNVHHADALGIFRMPLKDKLSTADYVMNAIIRLTK